MVFSPTTTPPVASSVNMAFIETLGLQGFVPAAGRGTVSGTFSGINFGVPVTIGFNVGLSSVSEHPQRVTSDS